MACNFTPVVREGYRLGVPEDVYLPGGSEQRLSSTTMAATSATAWACPRRPLNWQSQPYSIEVTLPPLSCIILKPQR